MTTKIDLFGIVLVFMLEKIRTMIKSFHIGLFLAVSGSLSAQIQFNTVLSPIQICDRVYEFDEYENRTDEVLDISMTCLDYKERLSTVWLSFEVQSGNDISFILTPHAEEDDIDFALFNYTEIVLLPLSEAPIRCVSTGINLDQPWELQRHCIGATGLFPGASDIAESSGCNELKDNFVSSVETLPGDKFLLFVTNYKSTAGFTLEFISSVELAPTENCESTVSTDDQDVKQVTIDFIYPNPVHDIAFVELFTPNHSTILTQISNLNGTVLNTQHQEIVAGSSVIELNVANLSTGLYVAQFRIGDTVVSRKFVKI